jgi:hypothetical protein
MGIGRALAVADASGSCWNIEQALGPLTLTLSPEAGARGQGKATNDAGFPMIWFPGAQSQYFLPH